MPRDDTQPIPLCPQCGTHLGDLPPDRTVEVRCPACGLILRVINAERYSVLSGLEPADAHSIDPDAFPRGRQQRDN